MPYPFDQIFAADPDNTDMVASNVGVLIFTPGDETKTPLKLTTLTGLPLANPVPVNDRGFGPAFMADIDQVAWEGGGFSGLLVSYKGLKDEAVAARQAAQVAALEAQHPTDESVDRGLQRADIPGVVAGVVSSAPTVVAAAAQLAQSNAGLVRKTDVGVPQVSASEDKVFAILDSAGKETWLGARGSDGGPTDWAMDLLTGRMGYDQTSGQAPMMFSVTDSKGRMTDLTVRGSDGQFPEFVIRRLRSRIGALPGGASGAAQLTAKDRHVRGGELLPVLADPSRVAGWGSSSMQGIAPSLSGALPSDVSLYRGGKGGEVASQIAARIGSVPAELAVAGGSIPSGLEPVVVTPANMAVTSHLQSYSGTLANIPGTLSWGGTSYVFTRKSAGAAVPVPPGTPFIPDAANTQRNAITLLWMGKNDLTGAAGAVEEVVRLTDATFDWMAPLIARTLIIGHFVDTGKSAGNIERPQVAAVNAAHKQRYGDLFVDVHAFLTGPEIWAATGITPTAADLEQQALGNKPPSVSSDNLHLNAAGYVAVSKLITDRLALLGWL